jgi:DNA polymerase V
MAGFHSKAVQLDLFDDVEKLEKEHRELEEALEKENALQETVLNLKKRFGKNTVLRGFNFEEGATGRERNMQIGGHKA